MTRLSFKRGCALGLMALALMGLDIAPAAAAKLEFIKFDGVDGESTDDKHKGEIDLASWNFGVKRKAEGVDGCAIRGGCTVFDDIQITNALEKSTPKLFGLLASGEIIPSARISVTRPDLNGKTYFSILFNDVQLSAMNIGGGLPVPQVGTAFRFGAITMSYSPQKADGSLGLPITAFYDLRNGEGSIPLLLTVFSLASSDTGVSTVPLPPALPLLAVALLGMTRLRRRATRV